MGTIIHWKSNWLLRSGLDNSTYLQRTSGYKWEMQIIIGYEDAQNKHLLHGPVSKKKQHWG